MEWLPPLTEARPRRSPRTDGFPQHRCVGMRWASPRGSESLSIYLPYGAGLGAQADARVPNVTVYPGVSTHWTGNLENQQVCRRQGASGREGGEGKRFCMTLV